MQYECSTYMRAADNYIVTAEPPSSEIEHDYCTTVALWYSVWVRITDVKLYIFCIQCSLYSMDFWLPADFADQRCRDITADNIRDRRSAQQHMLAFLFDEQNRKWQHFGFHHSVPHPEKPPLKENDANRTITGRKCWHFLFGLCWWFKSGVHIC